MVTCVQLFKLLTFEPCSDSHGSPRIVDNGEVCRKQIYAKAQKFPEHGCKVCPLAYNPIPKNIFILNDGVLQGLPAFKNRAYFHFIRIHNLFTCNCHLTSLLLQWLCFPNFWSMVCSNICKNRINRTQLDNPLIS